ncbi:uracil-DNA glycosylase [Leucothrix arctica]|uniref:Uracil-DNA glycosylase n=1 Tax=Leucothrix arctica TaxID=1481894 RepID=A0A317CT06_9GAMM|nr:uracil-DNA glycosylase [Leucothrix arctica]PWQ99570.1 uracil-DNA glycosylase [Leucothrix arctica]
MVKGLDLHPSWLNVIGDEFEKPYMQQLNDFLNEEETAQKVILPPKKLRFNALNSTPFDQVKVVVLGQDPYPTVGHAHGLCFSAMPEVKPLPKSLININKELLEDLDIDNSHTAYLQPWTEQGVLLLNAVLTVEAGNANAHQGKGWESFTDAIIASINEHAESVVFILWGAYAQKKASFIDTNRHLVIKSVHPSPLSAYRGFYGSKPFSKTNDYLVSHGKSAINWQL